MSDRPLSLIEVLVAEYDQQATLNGWEQLPPPYRIKNRDENSQEETITERCNKIESEAKNLAGSDAEQQKSSVLTTEELSPEQQEFFCKETDKLAEDFYKHLHKLAKKDPADPEKKLVQRAAICFSGGGIRSATFVLGLLQGLAESGIGLNKFHFVSTVSGGGYIGSWLSAWTHRQGIDRVQDGLSPLSDRLLKQKISAPASTPIIATDPEPETIQHLRRYSNYMSPRLGLLSADTWTLVGTFLRNLFLNWLVLIPLLITALAVPRVAMSIASWNYPRVWAEQTAIWLAVVFGILSLAYMIANLPSLRAVSKFPERRKTEPGFLFMSWLPLVTAAFLSSAYWSWIHIPDGRTPVRLFGLAQTKPLAFALFGLLFHLGGYVLARVLWVRKNDWVDLIVRALTGALGGVCLWAATLAFPVPVQIAEIERQTPAVENKIATPAPTPLPPNTYEVSVSKPETDGKVQISVKQPATPATEAQKKLADFRQKLRRAGLYVCLAPSLFLLMFLIAATVFTGLASGHTNDADREWMARVGGWMLIAILGWSALAALVIFGPAGLLWAWREFYYSLLSVSAGSGLLTLFGGFSSKSAPDKKAKQQANPVVQLLTSSLPLAAGIFLILILSALSLATSGLVKVAYNSARVEGGLLYDFANWVVTTFPWVNKIFAMPFPASVRAWAELPAFSTQNAWWHLEVLYHAPTILVISVVGTILLIGLLMGLFVNINKFSLHSAYRDRLIRAYLGASNNTRQPNPFTGFDSQDNIQMHDLLTARFREDSFINLEKLIEQLNTVTDVAARFVRQRLSANTEKLLSAYPNVDDGELRHALTDDFNRIIQGAPLHEQLAFRTRSEEVKEIADLIAKQPWVPLFPFRRLKNTLLRQVFVEKLRINRLLIEDLFKGKLSSCARVEKKARPLHVINIALNLVGGKELAWQERKAQPFTVSPLHAGSYGLGYRDVKTYAVSRQQDGALTLGTSLAISGAAVSPNMGFNSSSAVTFLLMLFNVRLGWWLGNPGVAGQETYTKPSPFFAPRPLIAETLGMTDSQHPYVYLSDGAHFENLALYEMVRRRCHFIVVSDAGADGDFNFDDLGNALRKIRIDLGVPIEFPWDMPIQPRVPTDKLFAQETQDSRRYCAMAKILYSEVDGKDAEDGWLIYIKPTVYGVEPPDVQNYAKANDTFPHETTGDQMYSESQFESYRALGLYVVETLMKKFSLPEKGEKREEFQEAISLDAFFTHIKDVYLKKAAAPPKTP